MMTTAPAAAATGEAAPIAMETEPTQEQEEIHQPQQEGQEQPPDQPEHQPPEATFPPPPPQQPNDIAPHPQENAPPPLPPAVHDPDAIWEPLENDIIAGRGARANARPGNKRFRGMCFTRKPEFEAGNHAVKRRIATEIVESLTDSRFLKRSSPEGPWKEMTKEQAVQKACQVMRDYKRPDRVGDVATTGSANGQPNSKPVKPRRKSGIAVVIPASSSTSVSTPLVENPFGVRDNDILSGRGAFVNGHVGNQRLRKLAAERKEAFDSGNFSDKQALAQEIVGQIRAVGGRFLKRKPREMPPADGDPAPVPEWEELPDEKAVHKACQVMRDMNRPDRMVRASRRQIPEIPTAADPNAPAAVKGEPTPPTQAGELPPLQGTTATADAENEPDNIYAASVAAIAPTEDATGNATETTTTEEKNQDGTVVPEENDNAAASATEGADSQPQTEGDSGEPQHHYV